MPDDKDFKLSLEPTDPQATREPAAQGAAPQPIKFDVTPLLTLDSLQKYLEARGINSQVLEQNNQRYIQMIWKFEVGDAAVLVSLNDGPNDTTRMEITCITHNQYRGRRAEVLELLNQRNRERHFARSIDADGNVWLEYVAFYPTGIQLPLQVWDTMFGGVLMHFEDDYKTLEGKGGQQPAANPGEADA
ncbi:MAG TPA: YbjN domain-containing protein [Deinococcales bacterium]|nr:YbjN domain-containing protein [Deinococcales bacterium]